MIPMDTLAAKRTVGRMNLIAEAHAADGSTGMRLTLLSGDKEVSKEIRLKEGMNIIRQRLRIRGRTFRFRLENVDGCGLTIPDGLEILLEEDSDL